MKLPLGGVKMVKNKNSDFVQFNHIESSFKRKLGMVVSAVPKIIVINAYNIFQYLASLLNIPL